MLVRLKVDCRQEEHDGALFLRMFLVDDHGKEYSEREVEKLFKECQVTGVMVKQIHNDPSLPFFGQVTEITEEEVCLSGMWLDKNQFMSTYELD